MEDQERQLQDEKRQQEFGESESQPGAEGSGRMSCPDCYPEHCVGLAVEALRGKASDRVKSALALVEMSLYGLTLIRDGKDFPPAPGLSADRNREWCAQVLEGQAKQSQTGKAAGDPTGPDLESRTAGMEEKPWPKMVQVMLKVAGELANPS